MMSFLVALLQVSVSALCLHRKIHTLSDPSGARGPKFLPCAITLLPTLTVEAAVFQLELHLAGVMARLHVSSRSALDKLSSGSSGWLVYCSLVYHQVIMAYPIQSLTRRVAGAVPLIVNLHPRASRERWLSTAPYRVPQTLETCIYPCRREPGRIRSPVNPVHASLRRKGATTSMLDCSAHVSGFLYQSICTSLTVPSVVQRVLVLLKLKGITEDVISISIVHWYKGPASACSSCSS